MKIFITKFEIILRKIIILVTSEIISVINKLNKNNHLILTKNLLNIIKKIEINLFVNLEFLTYVYKKRYGIENNITTIETIALRGSNCDYGFYPNNWNNSYNFGLISSDFYINYYLYKKYREKLASLKNVVYFLNVPSPGYSIIETKEKYRTSVYKYFFEIPYQKENLISRRYENYIFSECKKIKNIEISNEYNGYELKYYYGTAIKTNDRVRTHLRENQREPDQLIWLKMTYDLIKEDNRKLYIIIPPYRSDYKTLIPNKNILFEKIYKLNLSNAIFIDFFDSNIFTDNDFGDTDHLNENGAKKLTNEIMQIIKDA